MIASPRVAINQHAPVTATQGELEAMRGQMEAMQEQIRQLRDEMRQMREAHMHRCSTLRACDYVLDLIQGRPVADQHASMSRQGERG